MSESKPVDIRSWSKGAANLTDKKRAKLSPVRKRGSLPLDVEVEPRFRV